MFGRYKFSAADSAGVGATTDSKKFFLPLRRQTTSKWSWREFFVCADIIIHFGWLPSPPKEKRRRFFISPFRLRVTECSLFTVQFLVCPPPAAVPFALIRTSPLPSSVVGRGKPQKTFVAPTSGDRADVDSSPHHHRRTNERRAGAKQKLVGKGKKKRRTSEGRKRSILSSHFISRSVANAKSQRASFSSAAAANFFGVLPPPNRGAPPKSSPTEKADFSL